jgi:hypothetical protein
MTDIDICAQALVMIGEEPIQSMTEDSPRAKTCVTLYKPHRDYCLGIYPWGFAQQVLPLSRRAAVVPEGWLFEYEPPANALSPPRAIYPATGAKPLVPTQDWAIRAGSIVANEPALLGLYDVGQMEVYWPAYFSELVVISFAAKLALAVAEQRTLAASFEQRAWGSPGQNGRGGLYAAARKADVLSKPSPVLPSSSPFIDARFSGAAVLHG